MAKLLDRRQLDPVKTRETIMIAAFDVFAEKGYDGASLADIAAFACVPKSLLQYHFGSKEELWKSCLEQKAGPVIKLLDHLLESGDVSSIAELVATRFRLLQENPKIARVLAWASMGSAPLPTFLEERGAQLAELCRQNQSAGRFPNLLFAVAAMDGWFLYRNLYSRAFGQMVFDDELVGRLLQTIMGALIEDPNESKGTTP